MDKISTSVDAKMGLSGILFAVWAVIQLLILFMFSGIYFFPGTIIFFIILYYTVDSITGTVKINDCHLLLNPFTKKTRAVFQGFYWKLPWETIQFTIDLETNITSEIIETFPTKDGSMTVKATILSKPDSGLGEKEEERSRKMTNFVKFTPKAIVDMQKSFAKNVMRPRFGEMTCEQSKSSDSEKILKKSDFRNLEKQLFVRVLGCPISDLDYNDDVQRGRNAVAKATSLGDMLKVLINSGYSADEAKKIAPLLDKEINLKRQVNDINITGLSMTPQLTRAIGSLITKFQGGNKNGK